MAVVTSRSDFEKLIALRMAEARLLMDEMQYWDGAYYLAGYAVEYALKVRIIAQLMQSNSFPEKKLAERYYMHDLSMLLKAAGLEGEMDNDRTTKVYWILVKDWSEQSRYEIGTVEQDARDLYDTIEQEILPWIKARW